jgi:hypothetical protein
LTAARIVPVDCQDSVSGALRDVNVFEPIFLD